MALLPLPRVSPLLLLAAGVSAASLACSSSNAWRPVPVSILPAAPAPTPCGAPASKAKKPAKTDDEESSIAAPTPVASAGPTSIKGDLPAGLAPTLALVETCKTKTCELGAPYPAALRPEPGSPAAVWAHRITQAGQSVVTPRDGRVDVYGLVLRGQVKVRGVEGATSTTLGPWGLFRAPGGAASVAAAQPDSEVIFVVVTDGSPIADLGGAAYAKGARAHQWKARPRPVETRDLAASADLSWASGAVHARLGFEGEGQRASLGALLASPDAPVPPHQHETSWEILTALDAEGSLRLTVASGVNERPVKAGASVAVPRGATHEWVPGHTRPLVGLQVYVPPGPEQRFKALAARGN